MDGNDAKERGAAEGIVRWIVSKSVARVAGLRRMVKPPNGGVPSPFNVLSIQD
jgi:hypothetical protein